MSNSQDDRRISESYRRLRRIVGILGVMLPFVLAVGFFISGGSELKKSISAYYHSDMRDIFVGVVFTIGWFLFTYKGYEKRDDVAGHLAGIFALGVALFPTSSCTSTSDLVSLLHLTSAFFLFVVLIYFSIFLFPKTEKGGNLFQYPKIRLSDGLNEGKLRRNRIYLGCGLMMGLCLVLILVYKSFFERTWLSEYEPVFWLESFLFVAFGFSWFVKGNTLFRDPEPDEPA